MDRKNRANTSLYEVCPFTEGRNRELSIYHKNNIQILDWLFLVFTYNIRTYRNVLEVFIRIAYLKSKEIIISLLGINKKKSL